MSVRCSWSELFGSQGVEGDQGDGECDGGVRPVEGSADGFAVEGQRQSGVHSCGKHAASGICGRGQLAGFEHLEQGPRSPYSAQLRCGPLFGSAARTCSGVISARDWYQAVSPSPDDRGNPHDVDAGGLGGAGSAAWGPGHFR